MPNSAYGSALHGTVKVEKSTRDVCFRKGEPVIAFSYTSNPGYKGNDTATLYIDSQIQNYPIVVQ